MPGDPVTDLSVIFGAVVGGLVDQGYTVPELQQWVEDAARARKAARAAADTVKVPANDH